MNENSDYRLDAKSGKGLVVMSLSYEGLAPQDSPSCLYRRVGGEEDYRIYARGRTRFSVDWDSPPGRLAVFSLPAGHYEFYRCEFAGLSPRSSSLVWRTGSNGVVTANNPAYSGLDTPNYTAIKAEPFLIPFEVSPGKAVYIGNLQLFWNEQYRKGKVTQRDTSGRDLTLLHQRYPLVEPSQIVMAVSPSTLDTDRGYWGSNCDVPLTIESVTPIVEAGLCKTSAQFLGRPVCDDWRSFLQGFDPKLPPGGYSVGATFRVELSKSGSLVWSEHNPIYAIYNVGKTETPTKIRIIDVSPENKEEEAEAQRYLQSIFTGVREQNSSLDQYLNEMRSKATPVSVQPMNPGVKGSLPGCGTVYIRRGTGRLYALLATKHSNAWEPDSHPVIYFVIFPSP